MDETAFILSRSADPTRQYCPECSPETDPLTELVTVCYCGEHCPQTDGTADRLAPQSHLPLIGNSDAGGLVNNIWCAMIHRGELPQ